MRRGSEKRRRNDIRYARFSAEEDAQIQRIMDRTGLSFGALVAHALIEQLSALPRARPRPRIVDTKAIVAFTAALLKAADGRPLSLLNQAVAYLHAGRPMDRLAGMFEEALALCMERDRAILELRLGSLRALGEEPVTDPSGEPPGETEDPGNE